MKRVLAVVAVVVMITGAVVLRGRIDHRDDADGSQADATTTVGTLVCASELAEPCEALARDNPGLVVRAEEASVTEAALVAAESPSAVPFDAWLVPQPFPEMVDEQRSRASLQPVFATTSEPIARSPLVIVVWNDRRDALATACPGGEVTWKCVGELGGSPWVDIGGGATWGPVKPGHPTPQTTAGGLLVLGQAAGSWFGSSDYATNDFTDPAFRAWFEKLERSIPAFPVPPRTPLEEMLSKGSSTFDLTGDLESRAIPAVEGSRDRDRLSVLYPSPAATADLVVAAVAGSAAGGRMSTLVQSNSAAETFADAGWRVDDQELADGLPTDRPMPPDDGLPRPGVLQALRDLWVQVIR